MTLPDEDPNSILADNDNRAIQGNVAMQVAPPDDLWIKCNSARTAHTARTAHISRTAHTAHPEYI